MIWFDIVWSQSNTSTDTSRAQMSNIASGQYENTQPDVKVQISLQSCPHDWELGRVA